MRKKIVFDMDGTIADLYNVSNWCEKLGNEDVSPYIEAQPLVNMIDLISIVETLKDRGWKVGIVTWLSVDCSKDYADRIRKAKLQWLKNYNFDYDFFHCVKYGTTKANCIRKNTDYAVLVDDNKKVRNGWHLGQTINANNDIITELKALFL